MESPNIERVLEADADLLSAAEAMMNREMGVSYTSRTQLLSIIESPNCFLLGAFAGEKIIGVIVGKRLSKNESRACLEKRGVEAEKHLGETVGVVTRAAASMDHQGQGIEQLLQGEAKSMLSKWSCDIIITL